MPYNEDELRDYHGRWTTGGLPKYIQDKVDKIIQKAPVIPTPDDYRMQHRPNGDLESSASLDNMVKNGNGDQLVPDDFYTHPEYYSDISDKATKESLRAIEAAKYNPEAEVTIYRSAPKGATINEGDWISLSPTYAKQEGLHATDSKNDMPVISMKVKAKDIRWDGNDVNEFGYYPKGKVLKR